MKRLGFAVRLTLYSIGLIIVSVALTSIIVYRQSKRNLETALADELLAIVRTAAPLIDGDLHERIYAGENGHLAAPEEFDAIRRVLVTTRDSNGLASMGSPLYTMRPAADMATSGELEFVVMTDPNAAGGFFAGNRYPAHPHQLRVLAGESASTGIYTDRGGMWISAAAPVRNSQGTVVGMLQADRPVNFFYREVRARAFTILYGAVIGILVASVMAVAFAHSLVRPIHALVNATAAIGRGDLRYRVKITRNDELGELAASFNRMAERLSVTDAARRKATDALASVNESLEQRVAERTVAADERARELAHSKTELEQFAYVAAHHLQEPLRVVAGYVQLLAKRYRGRLDADADEFVSYVVDGVRRIQNLLNDLLAYSQVGARPRPFERVDCNALFTQVARNLQPAIEESGALVTRGALPTVFGDPTLLRQLLQNLVSNGLKFRRKDAQALVQVNAQEKGGVWQFSVTDNGIGIDPHHYPRLFVLFQRLHATGEYAGTGTGLAVCKKVLERHGGRIWVESESGQGSTFYFTLPIAQVDAPGGDAACDTPGSPSRSA